MIEWRDSLTEAATTIQDTPTKIQDNPNWRRHKGACVNYRERWSGGDEEGDDGCRLLYQIVCLMGTPPLTAHEQTRCMGATRGCWRLTAPEAVESADDDSTETRGRGTRRGRYASTAS